MNRKWNRGWRFFLKQWFWFFIIAGFIIIVGVKNANNEPEPAPTSEPFYSPVILTPGPSYQIPSEFLEHMAVEASKN